MADKSPQIAEEASNETSKPGIGEIISGIPRQVSAIPENISANVKPEIEKTKADAKAKGKAIGVGSGLTVAAVVLVAYGFLFLLLALAAAFATIMPWWGGFLLVGAIVLVVGGILTYIAKNRFDKSKEIDVSLKAGVKRSAEGFKKGIKKPEE